VAYLKIVQKPTFYSKHVFIKISTLTPRKRSYL